jgi:nanoRNase/pAp phosphatase (c-di-AMP/oligoRNAs hydrolase)
MEGLFQAKKLIDNAESVMVLAPKHPSVDSLASALSLSYSLNNLGKIVNFFPKKIPSAYSQIFPDKPLPEKFLISVKGKEISELYYEKENQILNIFLSSKNDKIEREDIKCVDQQQDKLRKKTDLLITIGVERLDKLGNFYEKNFKLFYQTPILNIDNKSLNNKFGNINLVVENLPMSLISAKIINAFNKKSDKNIKMWLLSGIIEFSQKEKNGQNFTEDISSLTDANLNYGKIIDFFTQDEEKNQTRLLEIVLKKIEFCNKKQLPLVYITQADFENSNTTPKDLSFVLKQLINNFFHFSSLIILWESISSYKNIRGVFYSSHNNELTDVSNSFRGIRKNNGIIFNTKEQNINNVKEKLLKTIQSV